MSQRDMRIVFSSGISNLTERNASFDEGVLRVAYVGKNRNNSFISKETFERCMPSIYNCPIVCRYDRETDSLGSHDIELVHDDDGGVYIVNATQPVGVVPESARTWWEEIEDDSGVHEYLCTNVLLWKRQEAYRKIKEDGITDESMEIAVKDGGMEDGVYIIRRFEFTAFCLLGSAEPCYESASLEMFSCGDFKQQLADMMQELKESFTSTQPENEAVADEIDSEGGEEVLDEKNELMAEYGLSAEELDFSIKDFTVDELREKFEAMKAEDKPSEDESQENFELEGQIREELIAALEAQHVDCEWGPMPRYWFVDYDRDASEVYVEDAEDGWHLYGLPYSMNGDHVVIDFEGRKRKKFSIVDFDEGEQTTPTNQLFELMEKQFSDAKAQWEEKFQKAEEDAKSVNAELDALRKFKQNADAAEDKANRDEVFAKFEDLNGNEAFENLKQDNAQFDLELLEEKCFAIRGRSGGVMKFSHEPKGAKLPVERRNFEKGDPGEPYGGLFAEHGITAPNQGN